MFRLWEWRPLELSSAPPAQLYTTAQSAKDPGHTGMGECISKASWVWPIQLLKLV